MPEVQFQYQLEHEGQTITYNVNPQHREKDNPNKSIWIVKPDVEYACFKFTYEKEWVVENEAWGFLLNEKKDFVLIGLSQENEELKIAKFKKNPNAAEWHGYPCNYMAKKQDVPSDTVMKAWVDAQYMTKAKMSKIQHQFLCNL